MSSYLQLKDSTEHRGDSKRLAELLNKEGYLFLRRLVDPDRALQVKRDIMVILKEHYIIS